MNKHKYTLLFYLAILIMIAMLLFGYWLPKMEAKEQELEALKKEKEILMEQQEELKQIRDELREMKQIRQEVQDIRDILGGAREVEVVLTAYTHAAPGGDINGTGDGITATGLPVQEGIIAVDPRVIPLGSKVWVEGYGVNVAADTGGAIRGKMIDLFVESREEAYRIGRRKARVLILGI